MASVHELKQLKAQLAAHSRSLHDLAASTRRLEKELATIITSARSTSPTTPALRPSRSGVSAEGRDEDPSQGQRATALERRWGNLF